MKTLAARCVELLNTDPPPRQAQRDPRIARVPQRIDVELAALKLVATATRQGQRLTITCKPRKGAPDHYTTTVRVEDL